MELSTATTRQLYQDKISVTEIRKEAYQNTQSIDVIATPIDYEEFFLGYLLPNRPCILDTWATKGWRSREEWMLGDGQPNMELMKNMFGDYLHIKVNLFSLGMIDLHLSKIYCNII